MYCEKCFTAIHQRWSYWEEGGDEGGLKLCKRCYADIKASAKPNRVLADLAHRNNLQIDNFIEKKEKDRPEYVDNWVQCDECHAWMHWTCGLYKGEDTPDDCLFFCDTCRLTRGKALAPELTVPSSAELAENALSQALQAKLHKELSGLGVTCNPVTVRVVSNVETVTKFDKEQAPGGAIKGAGENARDRTPLPELLVGANGEETFLERLDAVIDCSGTYGNGTQPGRARALSASLMTSLLM
jgi:hypothetical protein